jgi:hypothetical protein
MTDNGRRPAAVALTVGCLLSAGLVAATATPAAAAAPTALAAAAAPATPDASPVRVDITRITPQSPKPGDTLTVRGFVTNTGVTTFGTVTVRLRVSPTRLINRTEVRLVAEETPHLREGLAIAGTEHPVTTVLGPHARAGWSITVAVAELSLGGNGVYVVGVEAMGASGSPTGTARPERIGLRKTFLPWLPRPALLAPTRLAWLWPLTARPTRDADGAFVSPSAARGLADAAAAGGRLDTLATVPGSMPVTWLVDPDLLESARALGVEHRIRSGKRVRAAPPDPVAGRWLSGLGRTLAGASVAPLPYGDPDLVALRRHGQASRIADAMERGAAAATAAVGRPVDARLAWPADGAADPATLAALRRSGVSTVVLDSSAVPATAEPTFTPTGRARVATSSGPLEALVADSGLTAALGGNLRDPATATLAGQRFLADTALITLERPLMSRSVLVAPPRYWSPPAGWLAGLFAEVRRAPWLQIVGTQTLQRTAPADGLDDAAVVYPSQAATRELPASYVAAVRGTAREAGLVTAVLGRPDELTQRYDAALLRAQSTAWRANVKAAASYLKILRDDVTAERSKVRVIGRDLVTLSSNSGTIPVTVTNETGHPVTVRLRLVPKVPSRLRVAAVEPFRIGAGRKTTIKIPAVAYANGLTPVDVQLQTPDGLAYGPRTSLRVNATNYGSVGLIVVVSAGVLLFVAAVLRNLRRLRRARRRRHPSIAPGAEAAPRTDEKVQA